MSGPADPLIELNNVTFYRNASAILTGISLTVCRGEHWVVLGPNGAGKSTLASIITANEWPTTGSVRILGCVPGEVDLRTVRMRIGFYQPAQYRESGTFHPDMTALDVVCTGSDAALGVYRDYPQPIVERARTLLGTTFPGVHYPEDRPFSRLSSGERHRTLLARALIAAPPLLLLDEPYESLDIPARIALEGLLETMVTKDAVATITILHRVEEIPPFATHALLLKKGAAPFSGPVSQIITSSTLSDLYEIPLRVESFQNRLACFPA